MRFSLFALEFRLYHAFSLLLCFLLKPRSGSRVLRSVLLVNQTTVVAVDSSPSGGAPVLTTVAATSGGSAVLLPSAGSQSQSQSRLLLNAYNDASYSNAIFTPASTVLVEI